MYKDESRKHAGNQLLVGFDCRSKIDEESSKALGKPFLNKFCGIFAIALHFYASVVTPFLRKGSANRAAQTKY